MALALRWVAVPLSFLLFALLGPPACRLLRYGPLIRSLRIARNVDEAARVCHEIGILTHPSGEEFALSRGNRRQTDVVLAGGHLEVFAAMRRFADSLEVQQECAGALCGLALWNPEAYTIMGDDGGIDVLTEAGWRFAEHKEVVGIISIAAPFTDFEPSNRDNLARLEKSNITPVVLRNMKKNPSEREVIFPGLCYFSNACVPEGIKQQMVDSGWLEDSVMFMRVLFDAMGIPGEVIWVNQKCFMHRADYRNRMADAGLLELVVRTINASRHGQKTDIMPEARMYRNSAEMMATFAATNATHREALRRLGAAEELTRGLQDGLAAPIGDSDWDARRLACQSIQLLEGPATPLCDEWRDAPT